MAGDGKLLKLKSSQGEIFEVEPDVACMSTLIKNVLCIIARKRSPLRLEEVIPLPIVKTAILSKVIDYCKHHKDNCGVSEWDSEYVNIEQEVLFDLMLAAKYLDIKSLLDLTCAKVDSIPGGCEEAWEYFLGLKRLQPYDFGVGVASCSACGRLPILNRGCEVCLSRLCRKCAVGHQCMQLAVAPDPDGIDGLCNFRTFAVTVSTVDGRTFQLSGFKPSDFFSSLRSKAASEFGWQDNAWCFSLDTTKFTTAQNDWTLHELGISNGVRLMCVRAFAAPVDPHRPFAVTVSMVDGQTFQLSSLKPNDSFSSLRSKAASELGWRDTALCLCLDTAKFTTAHHVWTLHELGISDGVQLMCVRASGEVLGLRRYALTERRFNAGEDFSLAVCAEYGEFATVADFSDFATLVSLPLGLHGSAFVRNKGKRNPDDAGDGHFFVCRHSGVVPKDWLVGQDEGVDDDVVLTCVQRRLNDEQMKKQIDQDRGACGGQIAYRPCLCFKTGRVMPVLVDVGPA